MFSLRFVELQEMINDAEKNNKLDDLRDDFVTLIAGALSRPQTPEELPPNAEHIADSAYAAAHHALCRLYEDIPYTN